MTRTILSLICLCYVCVLPSPSFGWVFLLGICHNKTFSTEFIIIGTAAICLCLINSLSVRICRWLGTKYSNLDIFLWQTSCNLWVTMSKHCHCGGSDLQFLNTWAYKYALDAGLTNLLSPIVLCVGQSIKWNIFLLFSVLSYSIPVKVNTGMILT